jgi:hypothetical protein
LETDQHKTQRQTEEGDKKLEQQTIHFQDETHESSTDAATTSTVHAAKNTSTVNVIATASAIGTTTSITTSLVDATTTTTTSTMNVTANIPVAQEAVVTSTLDVIEQTTTTCHTIAPENEPTSHADQSLLLQSHQPSQDVSSTTNNDNLPLTLQIPSLRAPETSNCDHINDQSSHDSNTRDTSSSEISLPPKTNSSSTQLHHTSVSLNKYQFWEQFMRIYSSVQFQLMFSFDNMLNHENYKSIIKLIQSIAKNEDLCNQDDYKSVWDKNW